MVKYRYKVFCWIRWDFLSIDFGKVYYQVELKAEFQEDTALSTKFGQFCLNRLPFGLGTVQQHSRVLVYRGVLLSWRYPSLWSKSSTSWKTIWINFKRSCKNKSIKIGFWYREIEIPWTLWLFNLLTILNLVYNMDAFDLYVWCHKRNEHNSVDPLSRIADQLCSRCQMEHQDVKNGKEQVRYLNISDIFEFSISDLIQIQASDPVIAELINLGF